MSTLAQAVRFGGVGVAASLVHVATGLSLERFASMAPWAANIAAFAVALLVSYLGNSLVTFQVSAARPAAFARFAVLSAFGFGLNQSVVVLLTGLGWSYAAALAVVVATVPVLTFFAAKYWALRS